MALNFLNNGYFAGTVGIGTESPSDKLDVQGAGGVGIRVSNSTNPGYYANLKLNLNDVSTMQLTCLGTSILQAGNTGNTVLASRTNKDIILSPNGTGNVGIGITTPQAPLSFENVAGNKIDFYYDTSSNDRYGIQVQPSELRIHSGAVGDSTGGITFGKDDGTTFTETMRITNAGGISFGSTGTAYGTSGQILKSNGNASPTWIDGSAIPGVPAGSGTLNTVAMWTPDGDTLGDSPITISGNNSTFAGAIFLTNSSARISAGGSGEIGFNYNTSATGSLVWYGGTTTSKFNVTNTGNATFAGDVGLGGTGLYTTSHSLNIDGTGLAIKNNVNGSSNNWSHITNTDILSSSNLVFTTGTGAALTLAHNTNATFAGTIAVQGTGDSYFTGDVGIGTTGPTNAKLVISDTGSNKISIDGGTSQNGMRWEAVGGANTFYLYNGTNGTAGFGLYNVNTASTPLWIRNGSNVGLGTTSPTEKLDVAGNIKITAALLSNQENTDVDTGTETVANVAIATYTAAFFDFVIKKTTNVRSGTVYACHDGTSVAFTETSTQDLGDTSDVTLSVDISGTEMRLRATTTSDDWSVKSLIRAI